MNLYAEIQKVTQIPQTDENIVFIRRKDSYEQNLKLKKIKIPQNVNVSNYILLMYSKSNLFFFIYFVIYSNIYINYISLMKKIYLQLYRNYMLNNN